MAHVRLCFADQHHLIFLFGKQPIFDLLFGLLSNTVWV